MRKLSNILFLVEGEPVLGNLDRAVNVARVFGARLTIAAVVPSARSMIVLSSPGFDFEELERLKVEDRKRELDEAVATIGHADVDVATKILVGKVVPSVLAFIESNGIDYLTKAPTPSDGLRSQLLGSADIRFMREAPCMVGIYRPTKGEGTLRAVAAVENDFGDEEKAARNRSVLDSALMVRGGEHTEIYVAHAWDLYGYSLLAHGRTQIAPERLEEALEAERQERERWLEALIEGYRESLAPEQAALFDPKPLLRRGDPRIVIPEIVKELDADVIGLGTASRKGLGGMTIGNTAEEILHRVDCAVVVHKAPKSG